MKKIIFLILACAFTSVFAQVPANYYNSAIGLQGYGLKTQLKNIISNGHVNQGYGELYNGYITTDTDNYYENDGTVLDMYSENPNGTDPYNYTHGNNQCGNQSSEGDCYNREHLMPQSWYNSASPMVADIHHVVPSDGRVNNFRGHLPFGEVSNPDFTSLNGSKRGQNTISGYSGTVFEPIDEFKGDIARIYFYMATRYQNEIASWEDANDGSLPTFDGSSDQVFEDWVLNMLITWHTNDPVSQREIDRNNAAYDYQGNANPFISNPEWVNLVWNPVPDTENPTQPTNLAASNITHNSVDLFWNASTDNVGVIGYDIYRNNVLITTNANNLYIDSNLESATEYTYYVVAKDGASNFSENSNSVTITTLNMPEFIFYEDFNDCATVSDNFVTYSETSNRDWSCFTSFGEDNSGSMQMNGYQEDVLSKDWLISSNLIEFSNYANEKLSVYLIHTYGTMSLGLLYSTDYDGVSDPSLFDWFDMPNVAIDTHDGSSEIAIQQIVNVDISSIPDDAYIAFKYYSNGAPTRWTIDNFNITSELIIGVTDNLLENRITIYPNPSTTNTISIVSEIAFNQIELFNILGQSILKKETLNSNSVTLNNLKAGIYLLRINIENEIVFKRIIIK